MKLTILILLLLTSCTKQSEHFRDKFTGTWEGTVTYNIPSLNWHETRVNRCRIIRGVEDTDLGIQNLGLQFYSIAKVTNEMYRYYPFEAGGFSSQTHSTTLATFYGRGYLNGDSLTESGSISMSTNGVGYTGTWVTKMKRIK